MFKIITTDKAGCCAGCFVGYNKDRKCYELERGSIAEYPNVGGEPMAFKTEQEARNVMNELAGTQWGYFEIREVEEV